MSLLVASVYSPSPINDLWLDLQGRFLRQTTIDYDHAVWLNGVEEESFLRAGCKIIGEGNGGLFSSENHAKGLTSIVNYFTKKRYKYCCILDSDCFPIRKDWLLILLAALGDYKLAATLRVENLDLFPHPCVFFMCRNTVVDFSIRSSRNLLGKQVMDVGCESQEFFPLLRTNVKNYHPILGAIYWHCFYHHGGGSRLTTREDIKVDVLAPGFGLRAIELSYYRHIPGTKFLNCMSLKLLDKLQSDPEGYIQELSGINISDGIYGSKKLFL